MLSLSLLLSLSSDSIIIYLQTTILHLHSGLLLATIPSYITIILLDEPS